MDNNNVTDIRPDIAGQNVHVNAVQPELIASIDHFAMVVDHWHGQKMEYANRLLEIPEGSGAELISNTNPDEVHKVTLEGDTHKAFIIGVLSVINVFKDLPFGASIAAAPEGSTDDNAAS